MLHSTACGNPNARVLNLRLLHTFATFILIAHLQEMSICIAKDNITSRSASVPNVILILTDDLGWADTTLYGKTSLYETPNIERLAARGMTFSSAYASPICSPTRASIMTGQNPARHGMTAPAAHLEAERFEAIASENGPPHQKSTNVKSATRLDPSLPTLGKVLKGAGYATAHFGKWHLGREPHSPLELGFDVDIPHWYGPGPKTSYLAPWGYPNFKEGTPGEHIEDRMAEEAVAWLNGRDRTKPFFMNYWQFSVHAPFGAKPELIDRYRRKIKRGEAQQSPTYAAMVRSLDDAVGILLDALDAEGIAEETVIVFYSDNGGNIHCGLEETDASGEKYITAITSNHPLRGGKGGIHEGGVRSRLIARWPGRIAPGSKTRALGAGIDLFVTILNAAGAKVPDEVMIDGRDFMPCLTDDAPSPHEFLAWRCNRFWACRQGPWKCVGVLPARVELFNLDDDPSESVNLAADRPELVAQLKEQWKSIYGEFLPPRRPGGLRRNVPPAAARPRDGDQSKDRTTGR